MEDSILVGEEHLRYATHPHVLRIRQRILQCCSEIIGGSRLYHSTYHGEPPANTGGAVTEAQMKVPDATKANTKIEYHKLLHFWLGSPATRRAILPLTAAAITHVRGMNPKPSDKLLTAKEVFESKVFKDYQAFNKDMQYYVPGYDKLNLSGQAMIKAMELLLNSIDPICLFHIRFNQSVLKKPDGSVLTYRSNECLTIEAYLRDEVETDNPCYDFCFMVTIVGPYYSIMKQV